MIPARQPERDGGLGAAQVLRIRSGGAGNGVRLAEIGLRVADDRLGARFVTGLQPVEGLTFEGMADIGPARGDLFVGTGAQAGVAAGNLRDAIGFVVLLPKRRADREGTP